MSLSDKACKAAMPSEKPRKLTDSLGLYLEVSPTGGKHWRYKYRYNGKEKRLSLGAYPLIGLADARIARDAARRLLVEGQDPGDVKKEYVSVNPSKNGQTSGSIFLRSNRS